MQIDTSGWSGEGEFTQLLLDRLRQIDAIAFVRVEDAPATRTEADYNFISNEIYVGFSPRRVPFWRRLLPGARALAAPAVSFAALESALTGMAEVGAPDYSDEGMLQYLKTERIVAPYQTRGYKLVELVRVYEIKSRKTQG